MIKLYILGLFAGLLLLSTCISNRIIVIDSYILKETPPGTKKISENFFVDETEIANIHWREYMYWISVVYGDTSAEYIAALPDTLQWVTLDTCSFYFAYYYYYYRYPTYNKHPLVGITQEQAEAYSKWRSERVFEMILVTNAITKYDSSSRNKDKIFTIDKYFKGDVLFKREDIKTNYYPNYRLPTLRERAEILRISDSVEMKKFENCRTKRCRECKVNWPQMRSDIVPCILDSSNYNANTLPVKSNCSFSGFYNLRGNVSEWLAEPNLAAGGSWYDKRTDILANDVQYLIGTNAWTGFRNVCEWKKWEE